ncbi:hypothetical protein F8M41_024459 [Gigaspora margarita]|uniref:WAP domain-containing protein n=1 Tax=Gigaspora margarita TaxID=4874 RepID=A0A8H3XPJ4_GIGMA|nr:hypothetical protein F8M41_024459 [Gigaspora margarita]
MKPIYTILLTFVIVFSFFGVSESNVLPRNGSFPAANIYHGLEGSLKERALSCPSYAPLYCPSYDFCCPAYDGSCCPGGCCPYDLTNYLSSFNLFSYIVSVVRTIYIAAQWAPTAV